MGGPFEAPKMLGKNINLCRYYMYIYIYMRVDVYTYVRIHTYVCIYGSKVVQGFSHVQRSNKAKFLNEHLDWVAVTELKLSYYIGGTLSFTIYTHYGNLI